MQPHVIATSDEKVAHGDAVAGELWLAVVVASDGVLLASGGTEGLNSHDKGVHVGSGKTLQYPAKGSSYI